MDLSASMVTLSEFVEPEASPLQPTKCQPGAGVAVSVTELPWSYVAWSGAFATLPLPTVVTVSACWGGAQLNVALAPFRGVGVPTAKSAALSSVSAQPEFPRRSAVVLLSTPA